jgi:hypothetical protein
MTHMNCSEVRVGPKLRAHHHGETLVLMRNNYRDLDEAGGEGTNGGHHYR